MDVKLIEVRDAMTFIPMMAVRLASRSEAERFLLGRAGYGALAHNVLFVQIDGGEGRVCCFPEDWPRGVRTYQVAHRYILENWDKIKSGDVVDVEYILDKRKTPKVSERLSF